MAHREDTCETEYGKGREVNRRTARSDQGFFRPMLAHRSSSIKEAFLAIRGAPGVAAICEYPDRHLLAARLDVDRLDGEGYWEFVQIGHSIYLVIENLVYNDTRVEFVPGDGLLSFHVRLSGELTVLVNRTGSVCVEGPSLLVWHQPHGLDSSEHEMPGCRAVSVTLFCDPAFIATGVIGETGTVPRHIDRFLASNLSTINYSRLPITSEILNTAASIANSPHTGRLRLIHMEAKALELFCLIVSAFDRLADVVNGQYSEADLKRLQRAREIMATRFNPVPSISETARELGINETKLKRGFKALFGKPVFEYGHECRMQHALQLLRDKHMPVSRVAEAAGYTHQTTFASAFKQHFGYRPKDVRKPPALAK